MASSAGGYVCPARHPPEDDTTDPVVQESRTVCPVGSGVAAARRPSAVDAVMTIEDLRITRRSPTAGVQDDEPLHAVAAAVPEHTGDGTQVRGPHSGDNPAYALNGTLGRSPAA